MKAWVMSGVAATALVWASTAPTAELDTDQKKLSYAIGMNIGDSLRGQNANLDLEAMFDAIRTLYEGGEPALSQEEAAATLQAFMNARQEAMAAEQAEVATQNKMQAEAFLAENAGQEGVVTTESGLQYKVLEQGDGPRPAVTDTVKVHYRGTLTDGTEFDSSYARDEPISFALNQVIPGWSEGVQLMPVGSKYMFYIKPELGYGEAGGGPIPPNSALIFEVELLDIES